MIFTFTVQLIGANSEISRRDKTDRNRGAAFRAQRAIEEREGNGFGPRRSRSEKDSETLWYQYFNWKPEDCRRLIFAWTPENVRTQFDCARRGMIARLKDRIAEAPPAERASLELGLEALKRVRFEIDPSPDIFAEHFIFQCSTVRLSSGLINEVKAQVGETNLDEKRSRTLGRNVLVLIISHELAHVAGVKSEVLADIEGVNAVEKELGPISELDVRTAVNVFYQPLGSSHNDNVINIRESSACYGDPEGRVLKMVRASKKADSDVNDHRNI